ncbi:MAG TPA: alpha/beta hydrolase-fold protein [Longimicrobiales bacterium]|nr:alpha/beta hydrolase-fold protein [Longimicrobiales bacterium]
MTRTLAGAALALVAATTLATPAAAQSAPSVDVQQIPAPLAVGETFTVRSRVLDEVRVINVFRPYMWWDTTDAALPVMYMPDGGTQEDFLHVMGLLQVSVMNGTMRPFLLVGIENTERRRDLTGPTGNPDDRAIAPRVGGSAAFREFIRTELMPAVEARYATTDESAIVGESLAGLFIIETLIEEPDLFDTYIAFDPSLWWNDAGLLRRAAERSHALRGRTVWLASSSEPEIAELTARLAALLKEAGPADLRTHFEPMPEETHATIYHPAALRAFRTLFAPPPEAQ